MIGTEIKRVLLKKSFYIVILIGVIAGCIGLKSYDTNVYFHTLAGNEEAISAFDAWLYAIGVSPSNLLKLILVILITIPFTDSFVNDRKTGYINFILTRCTFKKYIYSKIIANAIAGALIVLLIYTILLIISGVLYPFNTPNSDLNYIPYGFFENIYMNSPFLYVGIILLIGAIFGLIIATLGLSSSILFNNKFAVTAFPFVLYLALVILGQVLRLNFLLPILLISPFSIIGVQFTDILICYILILTLTFTQLFILITNRKSEIY